MLLRFVAVLVLCCGLACGFKLNVFKQNLVRTLQRNGAIAFSVVSIGANTILPAVASESIVPSTSTSIVLSAAADSQSGSLENQLKVVQALQLSKQKEDVQQADSKAMSSELLMEEGQLVARGVIQLTSKDWNKEALPLGYSNSLDIDGAYSAESGSLIVLAVGREGGTPLAAHRYELNPKKGEKLKFPHVFQVTTDDLIFPYNKEAWLSSRNRADTIAVSAFLTPDYRLAIPNESVRVGFGLSDPITVAGKLTRSSANINVQEKLDPKLYTEEEVSVLSNIDTSLANRSNKK